MNLDLWLEDPEEPRHGALISKDGVYRYMLWRVLDPGNIRTCVFIMLNPSTADATRDDPTIRRCINFAKREKCGRLEILNLFAFRSPSPAVMKKHPEPIGPNNDLHIRFTVAAASIIILAWGMHGKHQDRDKVIIQMLWNDGLDKKVYCLERTRYGSPRHPLYVKANKTLMPFRIREGGEDGGLECPRCHKDKVEFFNPAHCMCRGCGWEDKS